MLDKNHHTGFAIAWPETYCKQPGYWYDRILNSLRISENHYYKVGHAALVLIDSQNKECHYFDFGRYHTPFQHGRVRSALTDHGLALKTIPLISKNEKEIENFRDILTELQLNPECHGEGELHASYCHINFQKAFTIANKLQQKSPIPYSPFKNNGSNCSRFVNTSILAGKPDWNYSFMLKYLVPLTPTPINNVNSLSNITVVSKMLSSLTFRPVKIYDKSILRSLLPQPARHPNIPETAQWLSGEGAGSWFNIKSDNGKYLISRFNQDGVLECEGKFEVSKNAAFNKNLPFKFIHLSTCNKNRIQQHNSIIEFKRVG